MEDKYIVSEELYDAVRHSATILPVGFKIGEVTKIAYYTAIEILRRRTDFLSTFYHQEDEIVGYDLGLLSKIMELSDKYIKIQSVSSKDEKNINLLEYGPKIINTTYLMSVLRDLKKSKEEYEFSLKYYKDTDFVKKWEIRFDNAYKEKNIKKINEVLNEVKELNKKTIIEFVNDKNDDSFAFIGHSVPGGTVNDLRNNFHNRFVSSSLLTSEFTDTHNAGYGYIMPPRDFISAVPFNSYTNNHADDYEDLIAGTYTPKIWHLERILEVMRKHQKENEETGREVQDRVYSEVVYDGFNPIGLFCFTNGLKEFDSNYRNAMKLKENSPGLELKVIDIFKYQKGAKLSKMKFEMLKSIKTELGDIRGHYEPTEEDVNSYEMFFKKLEELKKNGDYTTDDIKKIYLKNKELLVTNEDELFKSKKEYSDEEIKYVLDKGSYFDVEKILSGRAEIFKINRLGRLSSYVKDERCKSMMDKCYPGLAEFSVLVKKVNVTEEMYKDMKKNGQLTFTGMNKYLFKIVETKIEEEKAIIASKKTEIREELIQKKLRLEELLKRKEIIEQEEKRYLKMRDIVDSEFKARLIENDLEFANSSIENSRKAVNNYQAEKEQKEAELVAQTELKEQEKIRQEEYNKKYQELLEELRILKKHPIINKKKISLKEQEIEELNDSSGISLNSFYNEMNTIELENEINYLDREIYYYKTCEETSTQEIQKLKSELIELFGTDDLVEIKKMIKRAKEEIENHSSVYLTIVESDIEDLQSEIEKKQTQISLIEEKERLLEEQKPQML